MQGQGNHNMMITGWVALQRNWEEFRNYRFFEELMSHDYDTWSTEDRIASLLVGMLSRMLQKWGELLGREEATYAQERQNLNQKLQEMHSWNMQALQNLDRENSDAIQKLRNQQQGLLQELLSLQNQNGNTKLHHHKQELEALRIQRARELQAEGALFRQIEARNATAFAELARLQAANQTRMSNNPDSWVETKQIESAYSQTIDHLLRPEMPMRDKVLRMYNNRNDESKKLANELLENKPNFLQVDGCPCQHECALQPLLSNNFKTEVTRIVNVGVAGAKKQLQTAKTCECKLHPGRVYTLTITFDETSIDEQRIIEIRAE